MRAYDDHQPSRGELVKPVWIVDDDRSIRWVLEKALAREGIAYKTFASAYEVLQALQQSQPQVLVSDIRMPGESGLTLLNNIRERFPQVPVIIMTAYSDLDSAVAAFQGGAFEYLPKPFDVDHAIALIRRASAETPAAAAAASAIGETPEMLGQAPAMQEVFRAIGRLSQSNVTVLITGESGTGKELVARALHRHSPRIGGPFVAINTAAIPKDLLESELFGHERGDELARRARHFLQKSARDLAVEPKVLSEAALRVLSTFAFPGNVRQLENICHWLTVMAPGLRIDVADLPPELRADAGAGAENDGDWQQALDRELAQALARGERAVGERLEKEFEKTLILRALQHTRGDRMEAAQWLGWGRNTLTRKIQELKLDPDKR